MKQKPQKKNQTQLTKADLTPEERRMTEKMAAWPVKHGLGLPALMFLDTVKPLSFAASQMTLFLSPALELFFNADKISTFVSLQEDRAKVDVLIREMEKMDNEYRLECKKIKEKYKAEKIRKKEEREKRRKERRGL